MADNDRAVVVGINKYPELGNLEGPENDANEFADWLRARDGGAVPAGNIKLILSSHYRDAASVIDAEPTTTAVDREFDRLFELGNQNQGQAGRRLYIFLAGHGFAPNLDTAALLMANAARGRAGYHLPGPAWADWFRQAAFFEEVVLLMDCCRENFPRAAKRFPPWQTMNARKPARYLYGFATDWSHAAREGFWRGSVRGAFSRAVIDGLRNALNPNGAITGASLESYVFATINADVPAGDEHQEPKFFYDKMDDITIARDPSAQQYRLQVTVTNGRTGTTLVVQDGALREVPGSQTSSGRWEWDLSDRGIYKITCRDGQEKYVEITGEEECVDVVF
jgi:Caspase domain